MYVDALLDREKDRIHIVERVDGKREYRDFPAKYIFYYDDPKGKFKSIYGKPVSKTQCRTLKDFRRELKIAGKKQTYESDFNPIFRILEENYLGVDAPKLHTCFFDIEVDFDKERGFSTPEDPFNPITAISLYLQWSKQLITLAIAPKGIDKAEAKKISSQFEKIVFYL